MRRRGGQLRAPALSSVCDSSGAGETSVYPVSVAAGIDRLCFRDVPETLSE